MFQWIAVRKLFERTGLVDEDASFWDGVPREQWGRFADSGGMTVDEQRQSIRDVDEKAKRYQDARQ